MTLTATSVHTPTAMGNTDGKKKRTFGSFLASPAIAKRQLHSHDADTAKTPFLYDVNALSSVRPDQVPRFFGALTDSDKLDDAKIPMSDLVAMQDRIDPAKTEAMRGRDSTKAKKPVVVRMNDKNYIADGHHRLAADWMDGNDTADVKFKDLSDVSNAVKAHPEARFFNIAKVDESLGMVFGWAIVCKVNGEAYYDRNIDLAGARAGERVPEHITEPCMLKASADFMEHSRVGNEQHEGPDVGSYVFAFPLTTEIAKAMGIQCDKTGLMVAYKAPPAVIAKFKSGEYTGFSIEGRRLPGLIEEVQ